VARPAAYAPLYGIRQSLDSASELGRPASGRLVAVDHPGSGDLALGAVAMRLTRPGGRERQLEIRFQSRDRQFALNAVTDLVDRVRETGAYEVLDPPEVERFPFPSFTSVIIGVAVGLATGGAVYGRIGRPNPDPEF
jgi:hypothetical protein